MHAAVVEFDALADAVGTAPQDDHLAAIAGPGFGFPFVGGIIIGRVGLEFRGAGVHQLVGGQDGEAFAQMTDVDFGPLPGSGQLRVGKAQFLGLAQDGRQFRVVCGQAFGQGKGFQVAFKGHDLRDLAHEPGVDARGLADVLFGQAGHQGLAQDENALGVGAAQAGQDGFTVWHGGGKVRAESGHAHFQGPQAFLQGLLEGPADGHSFAHALHGRGQGVL